MVRHIISREESLSRAVTLTSIACLKCQVFRDECQTMSASWFGNMFEQNNGYFVVVLNTYECDASYMKQCPLQLKLRIVTIVTYAILHTRAYCVVQSNSLNIIQVNFLF